MAMVVMSAYVLLLGVVFAALGTYFAWRDDRRTERETAHAPASARRETAPSTVARSIGPRATS